MMKSRFALLAIIAIAVLFQVRDWNFVNAQATNPPYLREMPTVDRVTREIQGKDAADTAARQARAVLT